MKPEAQRTAIAEACGWHSDNGTSNWPSFGYRKEEHYPNPPERLPDYLNDLNAMHEAEKVLDDHQKDVFAAALGQLTGGRQIDFGAERINCTTQILFATAAQRAEAFLRTIGKWEDDK